MLKQTPEGVIILIKVATKVNKSQLVGWEAGRLKIRIAAVPVKGAANRELIRFLAELLSLAKSQFELLGGETAQHKKILVRGLSASELMARITKILEST